MQISIHRRVLTWSLGALALGTALLLVGFYEVLSDEMGEVFADNLKQVALAVASHPEALEEQATETARRLSLQLPRIYEEYGDFEFVTAVWTRDGKLLHTSDPRARLPFLVRNGLSTVETYNKEATNRWHIYTVVLDDRIVQAAQRAEERELLARETANKLTLPILGLLVVVAGLLTFGLRRGLAPLSSAAADVAARSAETLHPIPLQTYPPELHPLVRATNDLMARLGQALILQRNFLADAAHELRTPITALRLQLQLLERATGEAQRQQALLDLRAGVERAQRLVEQLLQLSRLAPDAPKQVHRPVHLIGLARSVVTMFSARADDLGVDLGILESRARNDEPAPASAPTSTPRPATETEVVVRGDAQQLTILLSNLVDNALRHTPAGGRVDIGIEAREGRACLTVTDNGPGIPDSDRQRVFDRFYRGNSDSFSVGSGLGLAIVKAVCEQHGASIELTEAPPQGLRVTVCFPRA
ncbi:sensor histidine kinase [Hylemonella gracilis]|uniref:histidine kinase n=1 Tax=Hylemonella gracilis ATCC 19624 TaxID=887062 RepID=F3KQZ7_9BURK|nr:ATP-binding protein [Hylemonella gracilis]EGI77698.1 integral membrane sensor signal transduction histidine kinase [Hylemonella gracilis ATCC 19624]